MFHSEMACYEYSSVIQNLYITQILIQNSSLLIYLLKIKKTILIL